MVKLNLWDKVIWVNPNMVELIYIFKEPYWELVDEMYDFFLNVWEESIEILSWVPERIVDSKEELWNIYEY